MLRKHFLLLTTYTIVSLILTYPLVLNFASAIPGLPGDAPSFVWALGWAKTALVDLRVNPFHTDYIYYPLGGATQLMWAVALIAFVSIPLQFLFGLIATHNLLYLVATVLTAYGTFLLAEEILYKSKVKSQKAKVNLTPLPPFQTFLLFKFVSEQRRLALRSSPLAPFVAGLVFAFAPLRLGYGLSFLNLFNTQLIPFFILFLIRALRDNSWRNSLVAGILLGLNAYIDFQIAAFLVLFTGLYNAYYWIVRLISQEKDSGSAFARFFASLRMTLSSIALVGVVSFLVVAPMLAIVADDFAVEGGNYIRVFPIKYSADRSYDLLAFFVPNAWSTLYADVPLKLAGVNVGTRADDVSALSPDRQVFVGYIVLALAAYATVRQWRRSRFWFFVAILFALFSLGPSLHVLGQNTGIPMPYLALHEIPIVNHIRIPMRYGIVVSFALAILAAIAIHDLQKRSANSELRITNYALRFAFLLLPVFILLESAVLPYPMQPISIPAIYDTIARTPGDFTVLEIPTFNWRGAAATEVYQAIHGKRILRAYTNRIAPGPAEYFGTRGTPIVVRSLRVLEGAEQGELAPEDIAEDKRVRDDVVRFFDLRYAVLHRSYLTPDQIRAIDAYLRDVLNARMLSDDGETMGYEIPPAPQPLGGLTIDLRDASRIGQMYAGRGWQFEYPQADWEGKFKFVWARGAQSEIYFVADELSLRAERSRVRVQSTLGIACFDCRSAPQSFDSAAKNAAPLRMLLAMTINAYADPPQRVAVLLNGERVGEIALTGEWKDYRITLPARALQPGMNRIQLQYGAELKETVGVTTITIE